MMMYTLYNGPAILVVSDDLAEIMKIRDGYPAMMRGFLSIREKGVGCTIKMTSDDLDKIIVEIIAEAETPVKESKPADKMYLPPIDRPDERFDTENSLYCFACGEHINVGIIHDAGKVKYLYAETHGFDGWDISLPQPRTDQMCWDCATAFKCIIQGREWRIIDFMEEGKKK